jgi:hypothetical protein
MRVPVRGFVALAFGVGALTTVARGQTSAAQTAGPAERALTFAVRADPRLAEQINAVLGRLAQPIEMIVPARTTTDGFLDRLCGGRRPANVAVKKADDATDAGTLVRFAPCLSIRRNVELTVDTNNTLEMR